MRGGTPEAAAAGASAQLASSGLGGIQLEDVAAQVGIDFRQSAFRTPRTTDTIAMMGGGVCWVDIDDDGWLDLFAVNSYSDLDYGYWLEHGGPPRSALFRNRNGTFTDVSRASGAGVRIRGNGCVAGDFNGDGFSDIYVTAAGNDALLWNDGKGHFSEGARAAGITAWGWHSGAAVGDVNGDGRPDLFVAGYTDVNAPIPSSASGFPNDHQGVRDLLYLNTGNDRNGHATVQGGRREGRHRHPRRARPRGGVHRRRRRRPPRPLRRERREPEPPLPEPSPAAGATGTDPNGLGFRLEERAGPRGHRRPECRDGDRGRRLQRRRPHRPARDQLPQAAARGLPQRRIGRLPGRRSATHARISPAHSTRGLPGGVRHGSISTSTATSTSCSRTARSPWWD